MENLETLKDYLLRGRPLNRAFVSDIGVYIVKDLRFANDKGLTLVIDVDLMSAKNLRERIGLTLTGHYSHLHDRKAMPSDIKNAIRLYRRISPLQRSQ